MLRVGVRQTEGGRVGGWVWQLQLTLCPTLLAGARNLLMASFGQPWFQP